jgi:hypothetical protein
MHRPGNIFPVIRPKDEHAFSAAIQIDADIMTGLYPLTFIHEGEQNAY